MLLLRYVAVQRHGCSKQISIPSKGMTAYGKPHSPLGDDDRVMNDELFMRAVIARKTEAAFGVTNLGHMNNNQFVQRPEHGCDSGTISNNEFGCLALAKFLEIVFEEVRMLQGENPHSSRGW